MKPFFPHVFACCDLLSWVDPWISQGVAFLPSRMRSDVMRYRRREDRCRSLAGKLLLRYGLTQLGFSADFSDWQVSAPNGRPFLPQRPVFSISHSGPLAVCGIAETLIGVDVESVRNLPLSDFKRVFAKEEMKAINEAKDPIALFFNLWTRKEAVLKAMGTGLLYPPDCVNVLSSPVHIKDTVFHLHPLPAGNCCSGHAASAGDLAPAYSLISGKDLFASGR